MNKRDFALMMQKVPLTRAFLIFSLIQYVISLSFMVAGLTILKKLQIHSVAADLFFIMGGICAMFCLIGLYFFVFKPLRGSEKIIYESWAESSNEFDDSEISPNFAYMIDYVIQKQKKIWHKELTLEYLKKDAELNALQSQINPHFLYNTLESIRGFALMQDAVQIADLLERLGVLFRNMTKKAHTLVTLKEELWNLENYIEIQKFRFMNKFDYQVHVDCQEELEEYKIPNLILQPIIENSISHGFETTPSNGKIDVYITITQSRLLLRILDNGVGIAHDKLIQVISQMNEPNVKSSSDGKHSGIALSNIHQRIQLQYGKQYGMHIASTLNLGTEVSLTLPLVR